MKRFETGKTYRVNSSKGYTITVLTRYKDLVFITGDFKGLFSVFAFGDNGLFGLGEMFTIPLYHDNFGYTVYAAKEV